MRILILAALLVAQDAPQGGTLYNGIRLPSPWPPKASVMSKPLDTPPIFS